MSDHYRTLAAPAEARLKVERSDFLALAFPVTAEEAFFEELRRIEKVHFDATHHCWAYRLAGGRSRGSDAGEPSGTAGKPILAAIESADVLDVGVIVVRWYGGVKLGTGGLSRAYRDAAVAAFGAAALEDRYLYTKIAVSVPFASLNTVYRLVSPPDVVLREEHFGDENEFLFDVRRSRAESFTKALTEKRLSWQIRSGNS